MSLLWVTSRQIYSIPSFVVRWKDALSLYFQLNCIPSKLDHFCCHSIQFFSGILWLLHSYKTACYCNYWLRSFAFFRILFQNNFIYLLAIWAQKLKHNNYVKPLHHLEKFRKYKLFTFDALISKFWKSFFFL